MNNIEVVILAIVAGVFISGCNWLGEFCANKRNNKVNNSKKEINNDHECKCKNHH